MSDEEICKELSQEKVIEVSRIKKYENGSLKDTGAIVLTFDRTRIPETINVGYMKQTVKQYYDRPMRCQKCWEYGHTKNRCVKNERCKICGQETPHETCWPARCVNCGLDHPADSTKCPKREIAFAIVKLMTDERISYNLAKKKNYRE